MQHNMANSSPVVVREPDLRQHVERPGRKPRQRALAEGAGDHRGQQEHRQARVGRQLRRREDPARAVVVTGRRQGRRHRAGGRSARATAGCAATKRRPARSCGSSTSTRRIRSGRRPATKSSARRSSTKTSSTSPTGRIRSTAKASATCTRSMPTKRGDITQDRAIWHYDKIRRSISTGAIYNGILFYSDFSGFLHALDVKTGQAVLDARHVRRDLGIADGDRRQGLSRRRGRRRHGPARRPHA